MNRTTSEEYAHARALTHLRCTPVDVHAHIHLTRTRTSGAPSTIGLYYRPTTLLALSPIGIFTGLSMLQLMRHPGKERMGWFYSHMGSMLGGGIAFHTAFAVFGAQRLWGYSFDGALGILPWILPTLIGVPGIVLGTRYYRRKFPAGATDATGTA